MAQPKFKLGEQVLCSPNGKGHMHNGAGWHPGYAFTVGRITMDKSHGSSHGSFIYWPVGGTSGVYEWGLESLKEWD